jgi:prepilin-type N-terminal cleavage/methylation domain-containing protein
MFGVRYIKKEQGFSLIELMIGIMILGIAFGVASNALANMVHWGADMELDAELQQEGKWALELMSRELRYADKLQDPDLTTVTYLPCFSDHITFTKTNAAGNSETITYGRGSAAGLAENSTTLGRNGAGGASLVIDPQRAILAGYDDLIFHVSKSGDNSNFSEIIISLTLTGVRNGKPVRTAVFETAVYKLNGN